MKLSLLTIILIFPLVVLAQNHRLENADTAQGSRDSIRQFEDWHPKYEYRHLVTRPVCPDSADVLRQQKKHFLRAGLETVGFNIGLLAFDRYAINGQYAVALRKISNMVLSGMMTIFIPICLPTFQKQINCKYGKSIL
jgi:hypothetical protein